MSCQPPFSAGIKFVKLEKSNQAALEKWDKTFLNLPYGQATYQAYTWILISFRMHDVRWYAQYKAEQTYLLFVHSIDI